MAIKLNVLHIGTKTKLDTLEIGQNQPSGGSSGRYFEWYGANGTTDGGPWEIVTAESKSGHPIFQYAISLHSTETDREVGFVENDDWLSSQNIPGFNDGSNGYFTHILPNGKAIKTLWGKI